MKTLNYFLALTLILGMTLLGCKKDKTNDSSLAGSDVAISQDAESQDAVADNIDQLVDDKLSDIEQNDFNLSKQKSASITPYWQCPQCSQAGDTITWPKKITILTFPDTTINGENLKYTGSVSVTDSVAAGSGSWRNRLIRKIKFTSFGMASDSSSVTVTGTRTVTRTSTKITPPLTGNSTSFRLEVTDAITANLTFTIICGDFTKSFIRIVDRTRKAMAHFEKGVTYWRQIYLSDTVTLNGTVSGRNLQDSTYSRVITSPITFTRCLLLYPIISSGTMTLTNGVKVSTLTYSAEGCKTKVTITRGDKTKEIIRSINRKYHKWW
jgi:hypothetical protein